jgi:hypothetical protein
VRAHIHPCHQHRTCNSEISTTYIAEGKIELVFENLVLWHSLQVPIDVFLHCGLLWIWSRNQRTFRPKKSTPSGSKVWTLSLNLPPLSSIMQYEVQAKFLVTQFLILCCFKGTHKTELLTYMGSELYMGVSLQECALYVGPCLLWWLVGLQGAQLRKHIDATLGSGNLREAVRLPPGEDLFEWLAVNSKILLQFVFLLRERERERNQNPLRTY